MRSARVAVAVLAGVLLVACTAPAPPGSADPGGKERSTVRGTPGPVAPSPAPSTLVPPGDAGLAPPTALPVETLPGGIDLTAAAVTEADLAYRGDTSREGAVAAAFVFAMAWHQAMATGDAGLLRVASSPDCAFCTSVADAAEASPSRQEDGHLLHFTAWPLGDVPARENYPYAVVSIGVEIADGVTSPDSPDDVEVLSHDRLVADVALDLTPEGWVVHGVATRPWDGATP